jgi:hypothetical protein
VTAAGVKKAEFDFRHTPRVSQREGHTALQSCELSVTGAESVNWLFYQNVSALVIAV